MEKTTNVICLIPVYNDWDSFYVLLDHLAQVKTENPEYFFHVVAVNDGSTQAVSQLPTALPVTVMDLKTNIGHQRAIAVGLQYVFDTVDHADFIAVMDGDGEDKPGDLPEMIEKARSENLQKIVFAERKRRSESLFFKFGYRIYKIIFWILTGQSISFGNFSVIPSGLLGQIVFRDNIWNHYSGSIIQSKIPFSTVKLDRGTRFKGVSKMNSNSLILHGLSSISVYFDFLSLRILKLSVFGIAFCFLAVLVILYQKYIVFTAIPGWASSLILIISGIILQLFSVTLIVLLLQLSSRKNITPPNGHIYKEFVKSITTNIEK